MPVLILYTNNVILCIFINYRIKRKDMTFQMHKEISINAIHDGGMVPIATCISLPSILPINPDDINEH